MIVVIIRYERLGMYQMISNITKSIPGITNHLEKLFEAERKILINSVEQVIVRTKYKSWRGCYVEVLRNCIPPYF